MHNKITINENSVITLKEASEILDSLFKCGKETVTKVKDWITGQMVDAYYYDCTEAEKKEHIKGVFRKTVYETLPDCKNKFELDFLRWVNLGWQIQEYGSKKTGEYLPTNEHWEKSIGADIERQKIWKKIKPVFYKDQQKQQNDKQCIQPEKSTDFDKIPETTKKDSPKGDLKYKMIDDTASEKNINTTDEPNLPNELNTEKAKALLQKAIQNGLCDGKYKWLKTKSLLAYFADKASEYLKLGKGKYGGRTKTSWKPFETLFGLSELCAAKNYFQRTGTLPCDYKDVDKLFE